MQGVQGIWFQSLGWEDPLEKEMTLHSQYSCLENSTDRRAWWATVHGVAKSRTQLNNNSGYMDDQRGSLWM